MRDRRLVVEMVVVLRGRDGDRLAGGPVGRGEGQRVVGVVVRDIGAAQRADADRHVRHRLARQLDRVGLAPALGNSQRGRRDQDASTVIVGDAHRGRGRRALRDPVGQRRAQRQADRFVVVIEGVLGRPERNRLLGVVGPERDRCRVRSSRRSLAVPRFMLSISTVTLRPGASSECEHHVDAAALVHAVGVFLEADLHDRVIIIRDRDRRCAGRDLP